MKIIFILKLFFVGILPIVSSTSEILSDNILYDGLRPIPDSGRLVECNKNLDCGVNGKCIQEIGGNLIGTYCKCLNNFFTISNENAPICTYKRKSSLSAFLLNFFLGPLGVGSFYLKLNWLGGSWYISFLILVVIYVIDYFLKNKEFNTSNIKLFSTVAYIIVIISLYITQIISSWYKCVSIESYNGNEYGIPCID